MVTSLGLCPVHQLFDLNTSMWHALILLTKGINSFVCLQINGALVGFKAFQPGQDRT